MIWLLVGLLVVTNGWWVVVIYGNGRRIARLEARNTALREALDGADSALQDASSSLQQSSRLLQAILTALPVRRCH